MIVGNVEEFFPRVVAADAVEELESEEEDWLERLVVHE